MTPLRRSEDVTAGLRSLVMLGGLLVVAMAGCSGGSSSPDAKAPDDGSPADKTAGSGGTPGHGGGGDGGGGKPATGTGGAAAGGAGGEVVASGGISGSGGAAGGTAGSGGAGGMGGGAATSGEGQGGHGGNGGASGGRGGGGVGGGNGGASGGRGGGGVGGGNGGRNGGGGGGRGGRGGASGMGGSQAGGGGAAGGGGGGAGGAGGASNCSPSLAGPNGPHAAHSAGYAGNLTDYSNLYNTACTTLQDCANACVAVGGTQDSCTMGSECIEGAVAGGSKHCLPPTYWRYEDQALSESADWTGAAEQTVVVIAYQDPLLVSDFRLSIPSGSTIRGIQFDVRRSADALQAVDDSIRALRGGSPVGTDHKKTETWSADLAYVTFGGPTDLWGATWTPADIQAAGFGISIADKYTATAGNARAYVDYVKATVYFVPAGCP